MKKLTTSICCLILSFIVVKSTVLLYAKKDPVAAVITQVKGKVEVLRSGEKKWATGKIGIFLYQGDRIRTGVKSSAVIIFSNGAEIIINQSTEFKLETSEIGLRRGRDKIRIKRGQVSCAVRARLGITEFSIQTPVATVAVRGTKFSTKVEEDGDTSVFVIDGIVSVENEFGSVKVRKNQITEISTGKAPEPPRPATEDEIKTHTDWQKDITIEEKILNLKIRTEEGEEKILQLKFRK